MKIWNQLYCQLLVLSLICYNVRQNTWLSEFVSKLFSLDYPVWSVAAKWWLDALSIFTDVGKFNYHNFCVLDVLFFLIFFPSFLNQKLGVHIRHENYIIKFFPVTCLIIFCMEWPEVTSIVQCVLLKCGLAFILFLLVWSSFYCKLVAFFCEHVRVFAVYTV